MPRTTFKNAPKLPFFLALAKAEISDKLCSSLLGTIAHIFTIHDEENDTKPPSIVSFKQMMAFMKAHTELPDPSISLSDQGVFGAVYTRNNDEYMSRFSISFKKNGKVQTVNTVKTGDIFTERKSRDEIHLSAVNVPARLRVSSTPFYETVEKANVTPEHRSVLKGMLALYCNPELETQMPSLISFKKMIAFIEKYPNLLGSYGGADLDGNFVLEYGEFDNGGEGDKLLSNFKIKFLPDGKADISNIIQYPGKPLLEKHQDAVRPSSIRPPARLYAHAAAGA